MKVTRPRARALGIAAIGAVVLMQAFNSFACYKHSFHDFAIGMAMFVAPALVPAALSLLTANPLRAVTSMIFFAPWLVFAYVTDCVMPYKGGGASMIYVAVLFWGLPCAVIGALVGGPITRRMGVEVHAS